MLHIETISGVTTTPGTSSGIEERTSIGIKPSTTSFLPSVEGIESIKPLTPIPDTYTEKKELDTVVPPKEKPTEVQVLTDVVIEQPIQDNQQRDNQPPPPPTPTKSKNKLVLWVVLGLGVLLIYKLVKKN